jgi:hypothetical protein
MIDLVPHADGVILPVRAQPRARRAGVVGEHAGTLKVAVAAAPERGKANDAIAEVLADELGLAKSQVLLVSGPASREKRFLVVGLTREQLQAKLEHRER